MEHPASPFHEFVVGSEAERPWFFASVGIWRSVLAAPISPDSRARSGYPSIVTTPGVCGGEARLVRTRIPVWVLERMRQQGASEIDILRSFPTLLAIDLVEAWAYARDHHEEIEKAIMENEKE
jgi:uncharacterized protein (DUF433 family)